MPLLLLCIGDIIEPRIHVVNQQTFLLCFAFSNDFVGEVKRLERILGNNWVFFLIDRIRASIVKCVGRIKKKLEYLSEFVFSKIF